MSRYDLPVAVIGAEPFGVSTAAYLRSCGVEFRIFGSRMNRWRTQMPAGMFLKSEGFASSLSDLTGHYTLQQFCNKAALPYGSGQLKLPTTLIPTDDVGAILIAEEAVTLRQWSLFLEPRLPPIGNIVSFQPVYPEICS
jgi:hypothetical protein